jgi:hypothetical protein
LILCIPFEILNARFMNSSLKAFLSSSSDILDFKMQRSSYA